MVPIHMYSQEVDSSDILFLKIQELEGELASLRSELESQAYLIEKLLSEEFNQDDNRIPIDNTSESQINTLKKYFDKIEISKTLLLSPKSEFIHQSKSVAEKDILKFYRTYTYDTNPKKITGEIEKIIHIIFLLTKLHNYFS